MMNDLIIAGLILVLLFVAAFSAMSGTAISRLNLVKAHHIAQEHGTKAARRLETMVGDPAHYLNVVVLITLLSHVTATALATVVALRFFEDAAAVLVAVVMAVVIFVFAEIAPRNYTVQNAESAALLAANPVYLMGKLLRPIDRVLIAVSNAVMWIVPGKGMPKGPFVTEEEIRHMIDVAEEEEEIEEDERELIHSIFEFGDTVVREVMVPRPDMVTIGSESTVVEALDTITKAGYSRIPVYEGDNDNIIGVLYAKDLLRRIHDLGRDSRVAMQARQFARAPLFVPEQKKVAELLREMQERRIHMAIVVDEYGGTAGLVTIEDLLEEIVGEIVDEYDREEPLVEPIDDHSIRVDAKMPIDEVNELLDSELPHEEWDTVGGLVFGLIGRVPNTGEKIRYDSLEFTTERVVGRRIQKVVITRLSQDQLPDE